METLKTSFKEDRFSKFYKSHELTDCTFIVSGIEIKVHRFVLACASQVFERMLYGDLASDVINIPDISIDEFMEILDFIYLNRLEIKSISHAWSLFIIANRFFIEDLTDNCLTYVKENVGLLDLPICYEFAEMYNLEKLQAECFHQMKLYFHVLFLSDYHMKPTTVSAIADKFNQRVNIYDLALKIIDWAVTECNVRKLAIQSGNILNILDEVNAFKCLGAEWLHRKHCEDCEKELEICGCYSGTIHMTIMNLQKKIQNQINVSKQPTYIEYPHQLYFDIPSSCRVRTEFKISGRIDLARGEELVSTFACSHKVAILGLLLETPMKPAKVESSNFDGTVVVRICDPEKHVDLYKASKMRRNILYGCEKYIPLREIPIIEPEKAYEFRISYKHRDNSEVSVRSYYCSDALKYNDMNVKFYDPFGTVIRGMTFCKA